MNGSVGSLSHFPAVLNILRRTEWDEQTGDLIEDIKLDVFNRTLQLILHASVGGQSLIFSPFDTNIVYTYRY